MKKRKYSQSCSLAVALDVIGERWTWLIIRGLLTGPKRFGELLDQLPGIGTNLLSDRIKTLLENGIVENL
jgi:DNA-binding HxlR family transcriptional regulator